MQERILKEDCCSREMTTLELLEKKRDRLLDEVTRLNSAIKTLKDYNLPDILLKTVSRLHN